MLAVQLLSFGAMLASVYMLLGAGLALVFSIVDIPNFAQAGIYLAGGYVSYLLSSHLHVPAVIGLPVSFAAGGVLGALLWYGIFRPLTNHPRADMFVNAFGIFIVLQSACALIFGPNTKSYPVAPGGDAVLLSIAPVERLWTIGITIVAIVALLLLVNRTLLGKAMRGVAQNRFAADSLGMDSGGVALIAMVIGSGLGAVAGSLLGGLTGLNPTTGTDILLKVFAILVIGGMGSLRGTIIAALVMGILESVVGYYASAYTDLVFFATLFAVLLLRPRGLFGEAQAGRVDLQ